MGNFGRQRRPDSGKNPLLLGESLPPAVLAGLAGTGIKISPTPDGANKYLTLKKERRQNVTLCP